MAKAQAVDRVHRIGQTLPVTITRYIVPCSIETVRGFLIPPNTQYPAPAYPANSTQYIQ
ncbi:hypothetical protein F4823DRAFT_620761 [Ustulina deusta]|nr:hypothetical protein F4823DRAFT_620761 [Ustulina deusta]